MNEQPAGYSGKPLIQKLGYESGANLFVFGLPHNLSEYFHDEGILITPVLPARYGHAFFNWQAELESFLKNTDLNQIEKFFWVSWPKKSSGVDTNLTEQTFRDYILPFGWVDTKVAAIDDTWSGLKFLRRKN
jgi:hypothetical protein